MNITVEEPTFADIIDYMVDPKFLVDYNIHYQFTIKLLVELIKQGKAEFILLREEEIKNCLEQTVETAKKEIIKKRLSKKTYELKLSAWEKLSLEERKLLKIKKPVPPKE